MLSPSTWTRIPGRPGGRRVPGMTLFPSPPPRPAVWKRSLWFLSAPRVLRGCRRAVPRSGQSPREPHEVQSQAGWVGRGGGRGCLNCGRKRSATLMNPQGRAGARRAGGCAQARPRCCSSVFRNSWSWQPCSLPQALPPASFLTCLGYGHVPTVLLLPGNARFKATEPPCHPLLSRVQSVLVSRLKQSKLNWRILVSIIIF